MNAKDLCLLPHLPALVDAGLDALKIEGRMKSAYYVAQVTKVYREAVDAYFAEPSGFKSGLPHWQREWRR